MEKLACPKCKHEMDEGNLSSGADRSFGYVSNKQTGMLRQVTLIQGARACPNCGYTELFLNPGDLKKRIG